MKANRHTILLGVSVASLFLAVAVASTDNPADAPKQEAMDVEAMPVVQRPWWVGDLINIFGIAAGVLVIVWQLGHQRKNELAIQKENYREELRLKIYQEFSKHQKEAHDSIFAATVYVLEIIESCKSYKTQLGLGQYPAPLNTRSSEYRDKHMQLTNSMSALNALFQKYEIVSPELEVFRIAFSVAEHDLMFAFLPLNDFLWQNLPMDIVDTDGSAGAVKAKVLTADQIKSLEELADKYSSSLFDLFNYVHDLNVELQLIFLSHLFPNEVERRQVTDPKNKVITTDLEAVRALKEHFENETAWGKMMKRHN